MKSITITRLPLSSKEIETIYNQLLDDENKHIPLREIISEFVASRKYLNQIDMSNRARNTLLRSNIKTLNDLGELCMSEISDFRNLGSHTLFEIISHYLSTLTTTALDQQFRVEGNPNLPNLNSDIPEDVPGALQPSFVFEFLLESVLNLTVRDLHVINARSNLGERMTHASVAEEWGLSRQRVHQIESELHKAFSEDYRLTKILNFVLPKNTFRGASETIELYPWLNLGQAIHPIGVSIFQLLVFAGKIQINQGWILSNEESTFDELLSKLRLANEKVAISFIKTPEVSLQVQEYLFKNAPNRRIIFHNLGSNDFEYSQQANEKSSELEGDLLLEKFIADLKGKDE